MGRKKKPTKGQRVHMSNAWPWVPKEGVHRAVGTWRGKPTNSLCGRIPKQERVSMQLSSHVTCPKCLTALEDLGRSNEEAPITLRSSHQ